jgi:uncharacterized repeat protein (TIGR03803 family)
VFEISSSGTFSILSALNGSDQGSAPQGTLAIDANGNLYGAANLGGAGSSGTIFELDHGSNDIFSLTSFNGSDAAFPKSGVVLDGNGNLYGTTTKGGSNDAGVAYVLPAGASSITILKSFNGSEVGRSPIGGLVLDAEGNLFGVTSAGGSSGNGTMFEIRSITNPAWIKPGSDSTWNNSTGTLTLTGKAWISANPYSFGDSPIISGTTSDDELRIELPASILDSATSTPVPVQIASISLSGGAAAWVATTPTPDLVEIYLGSLTTTSGTGNNSTFDLNNSAMLISYGSPGSDPLSTIKTYLNHGFNGTAWTGTDGIITSAGAANPSHTTGIGYSDSADGTGDNPTANSILLKYTLYGDANLDAHEAVDIFDLNAMLPHFNTTGNAWTSGDFNYSTNGATDIFDLNALLPNFNQKLDHTSSAAVAIAGQTTFAVGGSPLWIAMGDVNGDGIADVVLDLPTSGTVAVMLGNGDGSFGAPHTFAAGGTYTSAIELADVNADGKLDVIAANLTSNSIAVLLGNGNGTFSSPTTFAAAAPWALVVADVNGDGKADIVATNLYGSAVDVLLGNGNGTFGAEQTFASGGFGYSVAVADFDGDGKPDLVVANGFQHKVSVLMGNGNGTFGAAHTYATEIVGYANMVAVGDVNGDGKADLIVSNVSTFGSVSVLVGNGNGTFGAQTPFDAGNYTRDVHAVDLNGDGKLDLVAVNEYDNSVSVLLGNGDGTFQAEQTLAVGAHPCYAAIADVNGDGKLDIVVADYLGHTISVLLNSY